MKKFPILENFPFIFFKEVSRSSNSLFAKLRKSVHNEAYLYSLLAFSQVNVYNSSDKTPVFTDVKERNITYEYIKFDIID